MNAHNTDSAVTVDNDGNGKVVIRGSEDQNYRGLDYKRFKVRSSGSADATLEGKVQELEIDVSGSSFVDARDLKAEVVTIDSSGSGKVHVYAEKEFRIDASGSAKIYLYGEGRITEKTITGSAQISRR